jgi:ABC-type Zn uptake system ZnuABC Zn-binding protein ZnuA
MTGCSGLGQVGQTRGDDVEENHEEASIEILELPPLEQLALNGRALKVVATTSIIGDIVSRVGGEEIELSALMAPGQDPHSYEPAARDLTLVAEADVVIVNGWDLEEALIGDLEQIAGRNLILPISAGIEPKIYEEHSVDGVEDHHEEHGIADPHVWFDITNMEQWVSNLVSIFSQLDPIHQDEYEHNAQIYIGELRELDAYAREQVMLIPQEQRFLVTNHEALGYFSRAYGFEELGTVLPAASTLAEPSANELAGLIELMREHGVCTIFAETTINDALARTVAAELSGCDQVEIVSLYTGALGPPGSGADTYIDMFRFNVDAIVAGLTATT